MIILIYKATINFFNNRIIKTKITEDIIKNIEIQIV